MKIFNEVFLLGFSQDDKVAYSYILSEISKGNPSKNVLKTIEAFGEPIFLHSTSWHYDNYDEALRLTWVAYIPEYTQLNQVIVPSRIARGLDATHPEPKHLLRSNVLAHALRHLFFLLETDGVFAESLHNDKRMLTFLRTQSNGMASTIEGT